MLSTKRFVGKAGLAVLAAVLTPIPAAGLAQAPDGSAPAATYADLVDLSDSARLVIRAEVRRIVPVEPERARGVRPGWARYYIEARTQGLIKGDMPLGQALRYLVDLQPDARGKAPNLKKKQVLLFASGVKGVAGDAQLAAPDAQVTWNADVDARVRGILAALIAPDAPKKITGVREALYVPGNLAGEGEAQFFLDTADHSAASITVQHKPGQPAAWGISFSEVAAPVGSPPRAETLTWYRLACFLPNALPRSSNLSDSAIGRAQAESDYRMVLGELGRCARDRQYGTPGITPVS